MKKIISILLVSIILLLLLVSYCELGQGEKVYTLYDGNSYMKLGEVAKACYLGGLIDGMSYMKIFLLEMSEKHSFGYVVWREICKKRYKNFSNYVSFR